MKVPLEQKPVHEHVTSPFGKDTFGILAERFARAFGTPKFIIVQTMIVAIWIFLNATAVIARWDPYPFILLNLAFSTQAAYAAPLILLAQTRQADRDKAQSAADAAHREEVSQWHANLILKDTLLTTEVAQLTRSIHERLPNLSKDCDG